MKASITLLFFILIITFISCEKNLLEFSCDPEVNKYVSDNKKSLSNISLDELNTYNISLQRAVFNSWDPLKKRSAWLTKLNSVLAEEKLNIYEKEHLIKLVDHVCAEYFSEVNLINKSAENTLFASQWISLAITELGWEDEYIAFLVYRLYTKPEEFYKEISEINTLTKSITTDSEIYDCNCSTLSDFCFTGVCISGNCNSVGGCGWLWSMQCNGNCY